MNNDDQAKFAKNVYQVPGQQSEHFETPQVDSAVELDDATIDQQFAEIEREEVRLKFEEIALEISRLAAGDIEPQPAPVETNTMHPDAAVLLMHGRNVKAKRAERHAGLVDIQTKRGLGSIVTNRFAVNSFDSEKSIKIKQALLHDLINQESNFGGEIYPADPDVTSRKFFLLSTPDYDEWFHQQTSSVKSKDFTNSYIVTPHLIQKSSTYFDEVEGHVKNVSVIPSDGEIQNLKLAVAQYYDRVSKGIYDKPLVARRRFRSKNDYGLTA